MILRIRVELGVIFGDVEGDLGESATNVEAEDLLPRED
jgi:hypothetical protein